MKQIEVDEKSTLQWPDGWTRTRIQDRLANNSWKSPASKYKDALIRELKLMGATSILVTKSNNERIDPGVSVWFSMKKEDFSWQDLLGLETPAPTLDQIDEAYRNKAKVVHPDRGDGGDIEMFKRLGECRKQAKAWVLGTHTDRHEYVVPCDRFTETRLNLAALKLAFAAFRSLERVGVPAILERTLDKAFKAALPMQAGGGDVN